MRPACFFADPRAWPEAGECSGRLIRAHLVKQQVLRREGHARHARDPRSWVYCCGGATGIGGHHGALDYARSLRIPLDRLPVPFVELMDELGLTWWVHKHYAEVARS